MSEHTFSLQHGYGTNGPFRTESVEAKEAWNPQPKRGSISATRFKVKYNNRWYRLYSDYTPNLPVPHFIRAGGEKIAVTGVCP